VLRRNLLIEINEREGIRLAPVTAGETLQPLPQRPFLDLLAGRVRGALGPGTRFAFARDGVRGFWVSFLIDEDEFWVMLPRERFEPELGLGWLGWGAALLVLALLAAWLIAATLSRPLRALAGAARRLGRGETPAPLAETGPRELATVSGAFNRMARDLEALERERAMVLAGISHDVRTPLSRLRLALEMSGADAATAQGIPVLRAPGRNADAVAELTVGLLLAVTRGIVPADADVRAEWFADVQVVGLTAGTSTPDEVIDRVEARIRLCAEAATMPADATRTSPAITA